MTRTIPEVRDYYRRGRYLLGEPLNAGEESVVLARLVGPRTRGRVIMLRKAKAVTEGSVVVERGWEREKKKKKKREN